MNKTPQKTMASIHNQQKNIGTLLSSQTTYAHQQPQPTNIWKQPPAAETQSTQPATQSQTPCDNHVTIRQTNTPHTPQPRTINTKLIGTGALSRRRDTTLHTNPPTHKTPPQPHKTPHHTKHHTTATKHPNRKSPARPQQQKNDHRVGFRSKFLQL